MEYSDDDDVPLHRKRAFGAGISRKPVAFVRASDPDAAAATTDSPSCGDSTANTYLSIVMAGRTKGSSSSSSSSSSQPPSDGSSPPDPICAVCSLPMPPSSSTTAITTKVAPHESSIAHQVCLAHSHPPSALDRRRMGLAVLSSQGWDPDARVGLGPPGQEGIPAPIKARGNHGSIGLGVECVSDKEAAARRAARAEERAQRGKTQGRKETRARERLRKRREERLREQFYRGDDVERYLAPGDEWE